MWSARRSFFPTSCSCWPVLAWYRSTPWGPIHRSGFWPFCCSFWKSASPCRARRARTRSVNLLTGGLHVLHLLPALDCRGRPRPDRRRGAAPQEDLGQDGTLCRGATVMIRRVLIFIACWCWSMVSIVIARPTSGADPVRRDIAEAPGRSHRRDQHRQPDGPLRLSSHTPGHRGLSFRRA